MLVADDDDDMLEELETEALADHRQAVAEAVPTDDAAAELDDGTVAPREAFVLLPFVVKLLAAHREGADGAAGAAMADLRRAVRRAERQLTFLDGPAQDEDVAAVEQRVRARTGLLSTYSMRRNLPATHVDAEGSECDRS